MAIVTLNNASISVGAVDLSDHCVKISIDDGVVEHDALVFQNTATNVQGGLPNPTVTATFKQDYASAKTNQTLRADLNSNVPLIIRFDGTAIRSGTNPECEFNGFMARYNPFGSGEVGEIPMVEVTWLAAGTPLTWLTTST